jgi:hypothetical protein
MGLPWVRLDTQWPQNPKFLMLAEDKKWRAITAYMAGLSYSGAHGTDGFIPYYAISATHGTKKEAAELVAVSLWIPCEGGWQINDWSDYQPSNEENELRSKKARDAAMSRWHGSNGNGMSNANGNARSMP